MKIQAHTARPPGRCDRVAGKALEALQVDPDDHVILQENLASYTTHLTAEFQEKLETREGPELLQSMRSGWAHGENRWTEKIRRDLDRPYSDGEVQERFEALAAQFVEQAANFPGQVYVAGSLVKGRFGAHSDLDLLAPGASSTPSARAGEYGNVCWQTGEKNFLLSSFPEALPVDLQGQNLLSLYQRGLQARGLQLGVSTGKWQITRVEYVDRQPEPKPQTSMMWSFSDRPC